MGPEKKMEIGLLKSLNFDTRWSNTSTKESENVSGPQNNSNSHQTLRKSEIVFEFRKSCLKFLIVDRSIHNSIAGNRKVKKNGDSRYVWCFDGCIWSIGIVFSGPESIFPHFFSGPTQSRLPVAPSEIGWAMPNQCLWRQTLVQTTAELNSQSAE